MAHTACDCQFDSIQLPDWQLTISILLLSWCTKVILKMAAECRCSLTWSFTDNQTARFGHPVASKHCFPGVTLELHDITPSLIPQSKVIVGVPLFSILTEVHLKVLNSWKHISLLFQKLFLVPVANVLLRNNCTGVDLFFFSKLFKVKVWASPPCLVPYLSNRKFVLQFWFVTLIFSSS